MTGIWLVSYAILWALALAGAALLALARELVELQRELEMARFQLAHERKRAGVYTCSHAPERQPAEPMAR